MIGDNNMVIVRAEFSVARGWFIDGSLLAKRLYFNGTPRQDNHFSLEANVEPQPIINQLSSENFMLHM